jgi:uncharacterized protein YndB with AHSA1/START domain
MTVESQLEKAVIVEATPEEVWRAWTTVEGVRSFFAPDANVDLRVGGAYEIYFDTGAAEGQKGSEGCRILSYVPGQMLSFSWNAPPQFEKVRGEKAQWVVLFFAPVGERRTLVRLLELGWRDTEEDLQVYRYFDKAWEFVLANLARRFSQGPIDWNGR